MLSREKQEDAMKTKISLALFSLFVLLAGCASLQTGGEVQHGRQALLEGKNEAALGYFYSAARMDPNYVYLGLTLAREGDRQRALKEIESGMRGINSFLDYISQAQRFSIGQFWDPDRDIRSAIQGNLAMISGRDLDWQRLTVNTEWLGIRMEQESDLARRQAAQDQSQNGEGRQR
jgi:hypothetical protein